MIICIQYILYRISNKAIFSSYLFQNSRLEKGKAFIHIKSPFNETICYKISNKAIKRRVNLLVHVFLWRVILRVNVLQKNFLICAWWNGVTRWNFCLKAIAQLRKVIAWSIARRISDVTSQLHFGRGIHKDESYLEAIHFLSGQKFALLWQHNRPCLVDKRGHLRWFYSARNKWWNLSAALWPDNSLRWSFQMGRATKMKWKLSINKCLTIQLSDVLALSCIVPAPKLPVPKSQCLKCHSISMPKCRWWQNVFIPKCPSARMSMVP